MVADERTEDAFTAPASETERLFYAYSVLCCLPSAMEDDTRPRRPAPSCADRVRGLRGGGGVRRGSRSCRSNTTSSASTGSIAGLPRRPSDVPTSRPRASVSTLRASHRRCSSWAGSVRDGRVTLKLDLTGTPARSSRGARSTCSSRGACRRRRHRGVGRQLRPRGRVRRSNARPSRRFLRALQLAEGRGRQGPTLDAEVRSSIGYYDEALDASRARVEESGALVLHAYDRPRSWPVRHGRRRAGRAGPRHRHRAGRDRRRRVIGGIGAWSRAERT